MPEQDQQQPDGAKFQIGNGSDVEDNQGVATDMPNEVQADTSPENEGRYDEQKAATIGAAVLESDCQNSNDSNTESTDWYRAKMTDIDTDAQGVVGGGVSTQLRSNILVKDAEGYNPNTYLSDLRSHRDWRKDELQRAETRVNDWNESRADYLEQKMQEYEKRQQEKEEDIANGDYHEGDTYYDYSDFADFLHNHNRNGVYPDLWYGELNQLRRAKLDYEKSQKELSRIELAELDKLRERTREKMQGYLNRQSDYYAELYELNPELFAAMPTKEFMENRDELAGLERTRAEQEQYEQGLAGVVNTLGQVLEEAADYEKSVKMEQRGDIQDGHQIWFDQRFLRNDYRLASMMNVFHGYGYNLSDIFRLNGTSYGNRGEHMDGYVWDMMHEAKANNGNGYNFVDITPEERRLWEETGAYFDDYTEKRLDVTPRQLIEGFSAIFDKYRAEAQAKLDEANARLDEFKQRFAPKQEEQPENNPENN